MSEPIPTDENGNPLFTLVEFSESHQLVELPPHLLDAAALAEGLDLGEEIDKLLRRPAPGGPNHAE